MARLGLRFDILSRGADAARRDLDRLGTSSGRVAGAVGTLGKRLGAGLAVGGLAFATFGRSAVDAYAAVEDATGAAGVQFGKALPQVQKFAQGAAKNFGLSQRAALDAANTFGTLGKSAGKQGPQLAGFSTKLTGLAADLASFKGTSTEQAIEAVGAALRGESEPIRAYGVLLDDATLRQEALRQGLVKTTKTALNPQQKVLATQALLFKQTSDAQGDYARTSTSTANTQKTLQASMENAQAALGKRLAPAFTAVRRAALNMLQQTDRVIAAGTQIYNVLFKGDFTGGPFQEDSGFIAGVFTAREVLQRLGEIIQTKVVPALEFAGQVGLATFSGLLSTVQAVSGFVRSNATAFEILAGAVGGVVAVLAAYKVAQLAALAITTTVTAVTNAYRTAQLLLNLAVSANPFVIGAVALGALVGALVVAYNKSESFRRIVDAVGAVLRDKVLPVFQSVFGVIRDRVIPVLVTVAGKVLAFEAALAKVYLAVGRFVVQAVWRFAEFAAAVGTKVGQAVGFVAGLPGRAASALGNLASTLAGKARDAFAAFVRAELVGITNVVGILRGLPGKLVGALGDVSATFYDSGKKIVQALARGILDFASAPIDAIGSVAKRVSRYIPHSPVEEGPLKVLNDGYSGGQIVKMIAAGITSKGAVLAQSLKAQLDRAKQTLTAAQAGLQAIASKSADLRSSVRGALDFNVSSVEGTDSLKETLNKLQKQKDDLAAFKGNLSTLRMRGVSTKIVNDLATQGVEQAGSLAAQLASASATDLKRFRGLAGQVNQLSGATAAQTAQATYGAEVKARQEQVAILQRQVSLLTKQSRSADAMLAELKANPHKIAAALVGAVR